MTRLKVLGRAPAMLWSSRKYPPTRHQPSSNEAASVAQEQFEFDRIVGGDCLAALRALPENGVDLVCTDPPYGIGFMGKWWDGFVPPVEVWRECLRVLKPGGFAFVMSAPRQDVLGETIANLSAAGFEVGFTSLYWTFASGFPKAGDAMKLAMRRLGDEGLEVGKRTIDVSMQGGKMHANKGKAIYREEAIRVARDPRALALKGAKVGFQPKPAVEVVLVAMKPLARGTYIEQALDNGKGVTWLTPDCAIPGEARVNAAMGRPDRAYGGWSGHQKDGTATSTRFPANILVSDEALGDWSHYFSLDAWAEGLPQDVQARLPFLLVAKPSGAERGSDGRGGRLNDHPTVKPVRLMLYLVTLGSRPGDIVLDPFAGSGTTLVAAQALKRRYFGIEIERDYAEIARRRVAEAVGRGGESVEGVACV